MSVLRLHDIEPRIAKEHIDRGEAIIVDVREAAEYRTERISQSQLVPLSSFDSTHVANTGDKKIILYCASGTRSRKAATLLHRSGHLNTYHLSGGLNGWKEAGYRIDSELGAPIDLMQQVQITAGSAIVLGTGLAISYSPWFLILNALVGAGLLYAGMTKTCGLAALLGRMPWNQTK